jgi:hypothetical protein
MATMASLLPTKRSRGEAEATASSPVPASTSTSTAAADHISIFSLSPVSTVVHAFLTDADGARGMQVSRAFTAALLCGFTFNAHVFRPASTPQLKNCLALYSRYGLRITRLCLPKDFNEPLLEEGTGRPLLPESLIALTMGAGDASLAADSMFNDLHNLLTTGEIRQHSATTDGEYSALLRRVDPASSWQLRPYSAVYSRFRGGIPPGALPQRLRCLQFNDWYEPVLQQGSIPPSVTFLQLGRDYTQPLSLLGASLTTLLLKPNISGPFTAGDLPSSLRWLYLGQNFHQPLDVGALPPQLQGLDMGQPLSLPLLSPGAIPNSVTHLRFCKTFNQPLDGLLPDNLQHLNLGWNYNHPITQNLLPSSLRELTMSFCYQRPLMPGSLPDGLQLLQLPDQMYAQPIRPGVIPPSVVLVVFPKEYSEELLMGAVPPSARWVRLPRSYEGKVEGRLSPGTEVVWFDPEEIEED